MGTRGAYGFHKAGIDKITYNHWDSYPTGLGESISEFIRRHSIASMDNIFERIILVSESTSPTSEQIEECIRYYDSSVSKQTPTEWYSLLRDSQGDLETYATGLRYMINNAKFLEDSLFCEWGYVINLDASILEIYRGFQKQPSRNRYIQHYSTNGYFNCKLIREVPIS